jgi:addiction module HigA family antidote
MLREDVLPELGLAKTEFAHRLMISRQHLYALLDEKRPVSPEVAAKLRKLLGNGPGLWLRLQADYDAWRAERVYDVSAIKTLKSA